MKRTLSVILLFALFALFSIAYGAGSITTPSLSSGTIIERQDGSGTWRYIKWTVTSTAGTASISGGEVTDPQYGILWQIWADPDETNQPDDNWDLEILNNSSDQYDLLCGDGANIPYDRSDETVRFTPLNSQGDRISLFGDTPSVSITNFNTAGTATADIWMKIRIDEE